MPTKKQIIVAFALSLSFAQGQAPGVKAATPAVANEPEQLSMERWFVGSWICNGTQHDSPTAPAVKFTDNFTFQMTLDDSWLTYHIDQTQGPHQGKRTLIGWGNWDANAKMHIRRDMNIGGSRVDVTTPGWDGDSLVFTGYMIAGDEKLAITQTFTKRGDRAYDGTLVITGPEGKPVGWEQETCKKVAK